MDQKKSLAFFFFRARPGSETEEALGKYLIPQKFHSFAAVWSSNIGFVCISGESIIKRSHSQLFFSVPTYDLATNAVSSHLKIYTKSDHIPQSPLLSSRFTPPPSYLSYYNTTNLISLLPSFSQSIHYPSDSMILLIHK